MTHLFRRFPFVGPCCHFGVEFSMQQKKKGQQQQQQQCFGLE
jgi:hypothetical protein